MARPKKNSTKTSSTKKKNSEESTIQEPEMAENQDDSDESSLSESKEASDTKDNEPAIRILYQNRCEKLTTRGVGKLHYEIGFDENIDEAYIRVAKNESSGAFSTQWIALSDIQKTIDDIDGETFQAVALRNLYLKRSSSNNHGFAASVLKAEKVIAALPKQPTVLKFESWDPLIEKIEELKKTDIDLPDTITKPVKKSK